MPLILIFLATTGTRILFGIPQELEANWAFRLTETARRDSYLTGAADAAMLVCVASIVILTTPLLWHGWGARVALSHAAFCLVMGALLVEILTLTLRKVPFTCAYLPGSANVRTWWPVYLVAFTTFTFTMAGVSRSLMDRPVLAVVFYSTASTGGIAIRLWRRRTADALAGFQYDDDTDQIRSVVA